MSSPYSQQATAGGEQLSWLSEKRLLSQRLEHLQQEVARLQLEKAELKQLNAELKRTLEQVIQAFTACRGSRSAETQHISIDSTLEPSAWFLPSPCGHTFSCFLSPLASHCLHKCTSTALLAPVPPYTGIWGRELLQFLFHCLHPVLFTPNIVLVPLTVFEHTSPGPDTQSCFGSLFGGRCLRPFLLSNSQVERERRRLKRYCRGWLLPDACGFSVSDPHKMPPSGQVRTESSLCTLVLAIQRNKGSS